MTMTTSGWVPSDPAEWSWKPLDDYRKGYRSDLGWPDPPVGVIQCGPFYRLECGPIPLSLRLVNRSTGTWQYCELVEEVLNYLEKTYGVEGERV